VFRLPIAILGSLPFLPMAFATTRWRETFRLCHTPRFGGRQRPLHPARFSQPSLCDVCASLRRIRARRCSAKRTTEFGRRPSVICLRRRQNQYPFTSSSAYIRPYVIISTGHTAIRDGFVPRSTYGTSTRRWTSTRAYSHGNRYYADVQNQGNLYVPFVAFDTFRFAAAQACYFYSFGDGRSHAGRIAMGLVDRQRRT